MKPYWHSASGDMTPMKTRWTRSEKWLWSAPLSLGLIAITFQWAPDAARRTLHWPQHFAATSMTNISSIQLSSDGGMLAATGVADIKGTKLWTSPTARLDVWDTRTATHLVSQSPDFLQSRTVGRGALSIAALTLSPDSTQIGCCPGKLYWELRNISTQRMLWQFPQFVSSASFSRDGRFIALSTTEQVFIVSVRDGKIRARWQHDEAASSQHVAWSPNGTLVASVKNSKSGACIEVHDAHSGRVIHRIRNDATRSMAFSPDGQRLIVTSPVGGSTSKQPYPSFAPLRCYDVASGALLWNVKATDFGGADDLHGAFCDAIPSPDGRTVAAYQHMKGRIFLLDAATGKIKNTLSSNKATPSYNANPGALAFSPDGKRLFARSDNEILAWDL